MGIPIKNQVRLCFVLLGFAAELMGGILVIQETYGKVIICFDQIEENMTMIDVFVVWLNCIFVPAFYCKQMLLG